MKRILIAEDDERVSDIVADLVMADGYDVIRAADGQAVLEQLRRHEVDLLILDINMPRLGGATLVARLRQDPEWTRFADLPIVIVSGLWDGASGEGAGVDRCARQDVLARLGK